MSTAHGVRLLDAGYGKAGVRLAKIERDGDTHVFFDLTVRVRLSGSGFEPAYTDGDNRTSLPTDTMRMATYAVAQDVPLGEVEVFGEALLRQVMRSATSATTGRVELVVHRWERLVVEGAPHEHSFRAAAGVGTATVVLHRDEPVEITSGLDELVLCKTTGSQYTGFVVDELTVLAEADDRILSTSVRADWTWLRPPASYVAVRSLAQEHFERVFATQHSLAVQHTGYAMAGALLEAVPEIATVSLTLPNRHHVPVDLAAVGRDTGDVFVVLDRPAGLIELTVGRV